MNFNGGVHVEEIKTRHICRAPGTLFYPGMRDKLLGAPGVWSINHCAICDFSWLEPQPVRTEIGKICKTYYTHTSTSNRRSALSGLKDRSTRQRLARLDDFTCDVPMISSSRNVPLESNLR